MARKGIAILLILFMGLSPVVSAFAYCPDFGDREIDHSSSASVAIMEDITTAEMAVHTRKRNASPRNKTAHPHPLTEGIIQVGFVVHRLGRFPILSNTLSFGLSHRFS